jgi:hypothetical protein
MSANANIHFVIKPWRAVPPVPSTLPATPLKEVKMKKALKLIFFALILASPVYAGQIYGSLKEDGRPVANATFDVFCQGASYRGVTDGYGAYSIAVGRGKCTFRLYHRNQQPSFDLYSTDSPLRYDFDVVNSNGSLTLVRR